MARRRAQWLRYRPRIDPSRLVFIDETWTKTTMAPLRGWAPRGERLRAKVPHRRWKTMTFIAALRLDRVDAPWLIDGPVNGERFRLYTEKVLLPTLRPGDIVVIDNLGSHKGKAIRRLIRSTGPSRCCQAEALATKRCPALVRDRGGRHRSDTRPHHCHRMPSLFPQCRTRSQLISSRSKSLRRWSYAIG